MMNNQGRKQRSLLSRLARLIGKCLIHSFVHIIDMPDYVCYYPPFDRRDDLVSHYFRARWYLPALPGICTKVVFFKAFDGENPKTSDKPKCMGQIARGEDHLAILTGNIRSWWMILRSRTILFWKHSMPNRLITLLRIIGKQVYVVGIEDLDAYEFRTYCRVLWDMQPAERRRSILEENRSRFEQCVTRLREQNLKRAFVFGNGPTLADAYDLDFSNGVRIVCNSSAKNTHLLDQIQPHFIVALDEVFHFGVSCYAERFRSDLLITLSARNILFVTLAEYAYFLLVQHPELTTRTIIIPCGPAVPNYDLLIDYWLPAFESVLPAAMLPIAATVANDIRLLGCDGKLPAKDNEDFWAHAKEAQYEAEFVNTSLECHPTFDIHRQVGYYERYNDQVAWTVVEGEREHSKLYGCLRPSNTPILSSRLLAENAQMTGQV